MTPEVLKFVQDYQVVVEINRIEKCIPEHIQFMNFP